MNKIMRGAPLLAILCLTLAPRLEAQGIGPLLDWIHRLSGPQFVGAGATVYFAVKKDREGDRNKDVRLRFTGVARTSIDEREEVDPDDASLSMKTIQATLELPLRYIPVDFGVGVAVHNFGGDVDSFWHYSIPIRAQLRVPERTKVRLRVGFGVDVFPAFDPTDFAPLIVDVSRDDAEAVLVGFLGLDIDLF